MRSGPTTVGTSSRESVLLGKDVPISSSPKHHCSWLRIRDSWNAPLVCSKVQTREARGRRQAWTNVRRRSTQSFRMPAPAIGQLTENGKNASIQADLVRYRAYRNGHESVSNCVRYSEVSRANERTVTALVSRWNQMVSSNGRFGSAVARRLRSTTHSTKFARHDRRPATSTASSGRMTSQTWHRRSPPGPFRSYSGCPCSTSQGGGARWGLLMPTAGP